MLEQSKEIIGNYFRTSNIRDFKGSEVRELVRVFGIICGDANVLEDGGKPPIIRISEVQKIAMLFLDYLSSESLSPKSRGFVRTYVELIYNWNNNTIKDRDLDILCRSIDIQIKAYEAISKARESMIKSIDYVRTFNSWYLPSYEINKEYLRKLLEEYKNSDYA